MNVSNANFEIKTRLVVLDFECEADVITNILRVTPTETWRKGDTVTREAKNRRHENGWQLRSPADPFTATPEDSVSALLALFPNLEFFRHLPHGSHVQMTCTLYGLKERPFLFLSAAVIRQLSEISADLDVDIYDLSGVEDHDSS